MVENSKKLKLKVILTVLNLPIQTIADEIDEPRQIVSAVINDARVAVTARQKLADYLSKQVVALLTPENETAG